MSARTALKNLLTSELATEDFKVLDNAPGSDAQLATKGAVVVQRAGFSPAPQTSGWAQALAIYLVVGAQLYSNAEDRLEELLPVLVGVVEAAGYAVPSADRGIFFAEGDSDGFHGYRVTVATITTTP